MEEIDSYKMDGGFVFQPSFYCAINRLKKQQDREELYAAIMQYMLEGKTPEFSDEIKSAIWDLILPYLRKSKIKSKSRQKSKRNQNEIKTEQNEIKTEQNEIKTESKRNQNGIKTEQNEIKTEQNEIKTEQ